MIRTTTTGAALALMLCFTPVLSAQQADCGSETGQSSGMSEATYRVVEAAQKALEKQDYSTAEKKLRDIADKTDGYERAIVFQTLGYVYTQQNRYVQAIPAFEEALKLNALPQQPQENLLYNTGQLYIAAENYDKAISLLERYIKEACKPPSPEAHVQLAAAYLEKKRFRDALIQVDIALKKAPAPKEQWLQLKLALHYELKQYSQCADTLIQLVGMAPDNQQYWRQLSSVLYEVEKDQESVAVLALAERQGFLSREAEYRNLLGLYMQTGIPLKAAKLWDEGIKKGVVSRSAKNLQTLSEAYILVREYDEAEASLKTAARLSDEGDIYRKLGQIYVEQERWDEALDAFGKALQKGVDKVGSTQLLLGVAAYNVGQNDRARTALLAATKYPDSEKNARQWLNYLR